VEFGGLRVRPEDTAEIVELARVARLTPRGCGHGTAGSPHGEVVVDMRGLSTVHDLRPDRVVVDAGATWRQVLAATLPHGLTPPVLTDYLGLSVGGTLAVGGVGGTSYRYGKQTDNVLELEVVSPQGELTLCSPALRPEVFGAVLGGRGRHGIITKATLSVTAAPETVRSFKAPFATPGELLHAQRRTPADHITGQAKPDRYELTAVFYGPGRLSGATEVEEMTYAEFADRMRPDVAELVTLGEWARPHPWAAVFLPADRAAEVITAPSPALLGLSGVVLITPLRGDRILYALLRTASPGAAAPAEMLRANQELYAQARRVGGSRYVI
jgi:cytokinin dehydrogenase